jgi:hypothetical protein
MTSRNQKLLVCLLLFIISLTAYILTSYPTVTFIDSGELAAACFTLGITHPTGYPLYTMLGRISTWFFPQAPVRGVILFSNLCAALAVVLLFLSGLHLFRLISSQTNSSWPVLGAIGAGAFLFGLAPAFWSEAVTNEVYTLAILLLSLLAYSLLLWFQDPQPKYLVLVGYLFGLNLANHLTSIFFLVVILPVLWSGLKNAKIWRQVLLFAFFSLLALSLYLYLPIRSSQYPILDWNHPTNWHSLWNHLTGWEYRSFLSGFDWPYIQSKLGKFFHLVYQQFSFAIWPFIVVGFLFLWKRSKTWALSLLFYLTVSTVYALNYRIIEILPYYLPTFWALGIFIMLGLSSCLLWLFVFLKNSKRFQSVYLVLLLTILILALPFSQLFRNLHQQNRSQNYIAYDLVHNGLATLEKNALVFSDMWDLYSVWLYLRFAENFRPDVAWIDVNMYAKSFSYEILAKNYPDLYQRSRKEIESFLQQARMVESHHPYDKFQASQAYQNCLKSLWLRNYGSRPIYVNVLDQSRFKTDLLPVPEGLFFRLYLDKAYYPFAQPDYLIRGLECPGLPLNLLEEYYLTIFLQLLEARQSYLKYFGQDSLAKELTLQSVEIEKLIQSHPVQP